MATLYIDRREAALEHDAGALVVRVAGERAARLPLGGAQRVVVRHAASVSVGLLAALGERGVGLLVLGGRSGRPMAHLLGAPHGDATVRLGQFALAGDPVRTLAVARHFVRRKLRGQLALLEAALAERPDARKPLFDGVQALAPLDARVTAAADLGALRGIEGAAAASFFGAYTALFAPALGFAGRNRRPPRDPVNAALSLGYTLAHGEAVRAAWIAGLDPFVGFLHAPLAGRESLASDLVEPCRPAIDRFVWELFRGRVLRPDSFAEVNGACLLGKAGRAAFYEAFEGMFVPERRRLAAMAAGLARAARGAWRGGA